MLRKSTSFLAIAGTIATIVLATRLNIATPIEPPAVTPPAKPVTTAVAASGIIEAISDNVSIGVPVAGLVAHVHVNVWDQVKAGQPLFTLDGRELEAQLKVDEASETVARATLKRLEDQLALLKGVKDQRAVSREEVLIRENDVAVALAQLHAAEAKVTQDKALLGRLVVVSPKAGSILQVNVRPGEYASATPKSAAIILGDLQHLQVRADVDEQNASQLMPGAGATAFLKGNAGHAIELKFVRVEPFVVPKTSLTGASTERVDTRVLQVIYSFQRPNSRPVYVGQQVDVFVDSGPQPPLTHTPAEGRKVALRGNS